MCIVCYTNVFLMPAVLSFVFIFIFISNLEPPIPIMCSPQKRPRVLRLFVALSGWCKYTCAISVGYACTLACVRAVKGLAQQGMIGGRGAKRDESLPFVVVD